MKGLITGPVIILVLFTDKQIDLIADYYNSVDEGLVNDRFTSEHWDFKTAEYKMHDEPQIAPHKWELTRGIGYSFGYNAQETEEHYMTTKELVHDLVDIVSKNGNLLINIGPKADGTISEIQRDRLLQLGNWLEVNGDAIYNTRPYGTETDFRTKTDEDIEVRFTQNKEKSIVYATLLSKPKKEFVLKDFSIPDETAVKLLGSEIDISYEKNNEDTKFVLMSDIDFSSPAYVIELNMP